MHIQRVPSENVFIWIPTLSEKKVHGGTNNVPRRTVLYLFNNCTLNGTGKTSDDTVWYLLRYNWNEGTKLFSHQGYIEYLSTLIDSSLIITFANSIQSLWTKMIK